MRRQCDGDAELSYESTRREELFGERILLEGALSSLLVRIVRDKILGESGSEEDFEVRNQAQALRRYLYENYRNKITLDSLCFLFRSNKTTICKQFRDEYGITVLGYLNSLRLKEAKRLITEGRQSVTAIADHLGFESIHYFTRFFKKMTGKTPTEYARVVCGWQKNLDNE
jgi:AraC-like DNA-binding protein